MAKALRLTTGAVLTLLAFAPSIARAQSARPITVSYENAQLSEVLRGFAGFSGKTLAVARDVGNPLVTAEVRDVDWQQGLDRVLETTGLVARPDSAGILRVEKERRVTVEYENASLGQVVARFAAFSGRTFALSSEAGEQVVTASVRNRDWQRGLDDVLGQYGFVATTDTHGVIRIGRRS